MPLIVGFKCLEQETDFFFFFFFLNCYAFNNRTSNYMKQTLTKLRGEKNVNYQGQLHNHSCRFFFFFFLIYFY